jgi:hypothetical protein
VTRVRSGDAVSGSENARQSDFSVRLTDCRLEECAEAGASIAMPKFSPAQCSGRRRFMRARCVGRASRSAAYLSCCETETWVEDQSCLVAGVPPPKLGCEVGGGRGRPSQQRASGMVPRATFQTQWMGDQLLRREALRNIWGPGGFWGVAIVPHL